MGWRRIFFTSKLQLQKMISRRRLRTEGQQEGQVADPDTKEEESPGESSEAEQTSSSEEESHPGIIPDLSLGTDTGTGTGIGVDTSSCCNVDPDRNPEPEVGSDSSRPEPERLLEELKHGGVAMPAQSSEFSNARGDCSAEPEKTQS